MNKKLIEKIQKLLALANSSNQNEAELASKKAQELLLKHNISMASVEGYNPEFTTVAKERPKKAPVEDKYVDNILIEYFFVRIVDDRQSGHTKILGSEENVEIALYVRGFLKNAFKDLYAKERKIQGWGNSNRNAFYAGVYKGLKQKLEAQKEEMRNNSGSKALILIDKALERYMGTQFKNLKSRGYQVRGSDEAHHIGKERGRNLNISRGLGSRNQSSNTIAIGGKS